MTIRKIYTKGKTKFASRIEEWCSAKNFEFQELEKEENFEEIDSLVIFNEDHNLDSAAVEIRETFERMLKPIHKIDINGTKQVITSHFILWVERNKCENILFVGTENILDNLKIDSLLDQMA